MEFNFLSCIAVPRLLSQPHPWTVARVGSGDDGVIEHQRRPIVLRRPARLRCLGVVRGAFAPGRVVPRKRRVRPDPAKVVVLPILHHRIHDV